VFMFAFAFGSGSSIPCGAEAASTVCRRAARACGRRIRPLQSRRLRDKRYLTDDQRQAFNALAEAALEEVTD